MIFEFCIVYTEYRTYYYIMTTSFVHIIELRQLHHGTQSQYVDASLNLSQL